MVRIDAVTDDFLTDKGKGQGGKSGNYRSDANRELNRFVEFLTQHEVAAKRLSEPDGVVEIEFSISMSIDLLMSIILLSKRCSFRTVSASSTWLSYSTTYTILAT